MERFYH